MLPKKQKTSKNKSQIYMKRKIIAQSCNIWPDDRSFLNEDFVYQAAFAELIMKKYYREGHLNVSYLISKKRKTKI